MVLEIVASNSKSIETSLPVLSHSSIVQERMLEREDRIIRLEFQDNW